MFNSLKTVS